jgi:hypothetical protein
VILTACSLDNLAIVLSASSRLCEPSLRMLASTLSICLVIVFLHFAKVCEYAYTIELDLKKKNTVFYKLYF